MTENKEVKPERIDWEWEYVKLQNRIKDCYEEIANVKQLYKKLNARITRMQYSQREEEGEEEPEEEREEVQRQFDDLPIEEKAILMAKLMDRRDPE